jgi:hypothetical protein
MAPAVEATQTTPRSNAEYEAGIVLRVESANFQTVRVYWYPDGSLRIGLDPPVRGGQVTIARFQPGDEKNGSQIRVRTAQQ